MKIRKPENVIGHEQRLGKPNTGDVSIAKSKALLVAVLACLLIPLMASQASAQEAPEAPLPGGPTMTDDEPQPAVAPLPEAPTITPNGPPRRSCSPGRIWIQTDPWTEYVCVAGKWRAKPVASVSTLPQAPCIPGDIKYVTVPPPAKPGTLEVYWCNAKAQWEYRGEYTGPTGPAPGRP